jgi:hypothetical protein
MNVALRVYSPTYYFAVVHNLTCPRTESVCLVSKHLDKSEAKEKTRKGLESTNGASSRNRKRETDALHRSTTDNGMIRDERNRKTFAVEERERCDRGKGPERSVHKPHGFPSET